MYLFIVRDKSKELCELLSDPMTLQNEREFARVTREKLMGVSSSAQSSAAGAPTSISSSSVNQMGS